MKKITTSVGTRLLLLALACSMYACSCNEFGKGSSDIEPRARIDLPERTIISYQINLDDSKKSNEEGSKVFYKVPVGTEVVITATSQGPQPIDVAWNMRIQKLSGKFPVQTATTWEYKPNQPSLIEVSGLPRKQSTEMAYS